MSLTSLPLLPLDKIVSLTSLPLLPLDKIASYLDFSSLVSLAASASSLVHLQPKEQLVKGQDFSMARNMHMIMAVRKIRLKGKPPCHPYGKMGSPADPTHPVVDLKSAIAAAGQSGPDLIPPSFCLCTTYSYTFND